jgi:hypothetical protein
VQVLKFGNTSPDVAVVQHALNRVLPKQPLLKVDTIFGPKTQGRVKEFQSVKNLNPDGIVGPLTLNSLFVRKSLEATVRITRDRSPVFARASPRFGIQPPNLLPTKPSDTLFTDPRDLAWAAQWKTFMDWLVTRKGPMPPMPAPSPPSASDPKPPRIGPGPVIFVPVRQPRTTATREVPNTGGNVEVKFERGGSLTLGDKPKLEEYKLSLDFAKLVGISEIDGLGFELESKQEKNGDSKIEVTVKVKGSPFISAGESSVFSLKMFPLLTTALNSPFDELSAFLGVGGLFQIRPFANRGIAIEIGGKLGAKGKITSDDTGSTMTIFPLHVSGTAGLSLEFGL